MARSKIIYGGYFARPEETRLSAATYQYENWNWLDTHIIVIQHTRALGAERTTACRDG